jgi:hypothetical protein
MCSEPLGIYFERCGEQPQLQETLTALWRCYIGSWEIRDDRLYLVGLSAHLVDGTPVTLETVFPGFPDRVFAHWFTGTLRIPQGRELRYQHMGYGSTFERDLLLEIRRGVLQASRILHNGEADADAHDGYRVAMTTVIGPIAEGPERRP